MEATLTRRSSQPEATVAQSARNPTVGEGGETVTASWVYGPNEPNWGRRQPIII